MTIICAFLSNYKQLILLINSNINANKQLFKSENWTLKCYQYSY